VEGSWKGANRTLQRPTARQGAPKVPRPGTAPRPSPPSTPSGSRPIVPSAQPHHRSRAAAPTGGRQWSDFRQYDLRRPAHPRHSRSAGACPPDPPAARAADHRRSPSCLVTLRVGRGRPQRGCRVRGGVAAWRAGLPRGGFLERGEPDAAATNCAARCPEGAPPAAPRHAQAHQAPQPGPAQSPRAPQPTPGCGRQHRPVPASGPISASHDLRRRAHPRRSTPAGRLPNRSTRGSYATSALRQPTQRLNVCDQRTSGREPIRPAAGWARRGRARVTGAPAVARWRPAGPWAPQ
jgi:hypothetical protein